MDSRCLYGHFIVLLEQLRFEHVNITANVVRMPKHMFDTLIDRIGPRFSKQETKDPTALEPRLKPATTIQYLSIGDIYPAQEFKFRVSRNAIFSFISGVNQAIGKIYKCVNKLPNHTRIVSSNNRGISDWVFNSSFRCMWYVSCIRRNDVRILHLPLYQ